MLERRSVLKLGMASVAGALVNVPIRAFGAMPADSHGSRDEAVHRAVFDERFEESRAFAGEMNRRGVITSSIQGDVAKLWYEDLRDSLRETRRPVAGLTERVTLFCLEELARDVGMKVFFRVDHLVEKATFGQAMAVVACRCDVSGPGDITAQKRTGPFSPEGKTALVSWVMA